MLFDFINTHKPERDAIVLTDLFTGIQYFFVVLFVIPTKNNLTIIGGQRNKFFNENINIGGGPSHVFQSKVDCYDGIPMFIKQM